MPTEKRKLQRRKVPRMSKSTTSGFSLLELTMVVAVGMILAAMAVPFTRSTIQYFRVRSAVSSVSAAIQSTRYRAIFDGCPYNITLNNTTNTYQVASETNAGAACAASFTNVGTAIPFAPTAVTLNQTVTLQFKPSGYVQATTGTNSFTLSYAASSKTISVSNYGNINVTP